MHEAASDFLSTTEACMLDVRDRGLKYETSRICQGLKGVSLRYIEEGGDLSSTPPQVALMAERGQTMAWMARALSAGARLTFSRGRT
jgi:hypothetical protein